MLKSQFYKKTARFRLKIIRNAIYEAIRFPTWCQSGADSPIGTWEEVWQARCPLHGACAARQWDEIAQNPNFVLWVVTIRVHLLTVPDVRACISTITCPNDVRQRLATRRQLTGALPAYYAPSRAQGEIAHGKPPSAECSFDPTNCHPRCKTLRYAPQTMPCNIWERYCMHRGA